MGRRLSRIAAIALAGIGLVTSRASAAAVSVTAEAYTTGNIGALTNPETGLNTAAFRATTASKFQDFPLNTGGGVNNRFARGLSNNSFAGPTILPIGPNGGATFKFTQPVFALPDAKEFAVHTGTFSSSSGGFFYGDMRGAVLVSSDGTDWRALDGTVVADPLTWTGTISPFNTPSMSYVWGTGKIAWDYCTGSGKAQSVLDTFPLANYETPTPNESLFNEPASTNAQRDALQTSVDASEYTNIFGNSAGGNWFDISATGLSSIEYLRINVASNAPAIMRLDSIFANAAAVPEPACVGLVAIAGLALTRRRRRHLGKGALIVAFVAGAALLGTARTASAVAFSEIQYWVGSGENQAGFVIDWNDGKNEQSLVWGFRWDGSATGETMLKAIVNDDPRFFAHVSTPGSFGVALYGAGYDLNDSGGFAVQPTSPPFDANGLAVSNSFWETATPTDAADHWREGWLSAGFWTYYRGGTGATPVWTSSGTGMSSRVLSNGIWDGWSFAPNFSSSTPSEPVAAAVPEPTTLGAIALGALAMLWRHRRRAVATGAAAAAVVASLAAVPAAQAAYVYDPNDFAVEVISSSNLVVSNDPSVGDLYGTAGAVLGRPTVRHNGNLDFPPGLRRTKIVEGPYNVDVNGNKTLTSFDANTQVTVRMGRPVTDDPGNPFGIDFIVYGNAFYFADGFVDDTSNMNTTGVFSMIFAEPVKVSVSPDNVNWFTYTTGPFGDDAFPTNGFLWNRTAAAWTDTVTDPTKPVNPAAAVTDGMSVADVLDLYDGAAGGTGFDLAGSGFNSIQYVRFEGYDPNGFGNVGEIDAVADVRAIPEPAAAAALGALCAVQCTASRRRRRAR